MGCKVSVIIPVYNDEKHILKISDCLLKQTLEDIEFVFVNDASTDNTLNMLYKIEKKNPDKVIVINSDQNLGPGGARNIALNYVSGEYIGFVDSDDLVKEDMFETMYNKAVLEDYDIVECGYYSERKKKNMMLWNKEMEGKVTFDKRVKMFLSCGFIWSKIFKREFIFNNEIEFLQKIPFEDVDYLCRIYSRANSLGIVNKTLYYYSDNIKSFSHTRNNQGFLDIYNVFCTKFLDHMRSEKIYSDFKPVIEYVVIDIWLDLFKTLVKDEDNISKNTFKLIDDNLKKYVYEYDKNIFLIEKAKKNNLLAAFLANASDSEKAINIIKGDK